MVNGKTFYVHVILHQACFYYYYYYFLNGDQCFMSGDHFYSFRLQTGVLGALHCRASDRSWKKKSNFVGFLGTN